MPPKASRGFLGLGTLCLCGLLGSLFPATAHATDYFLVLAGGYSPAGNQASLEANVLFFRQVLQEQHRGARSMTTFFADGNDEKADLQYSVEIAESPAPATALLSSLTSFRGSSNSRIRYRNHEVDDTAGPLRPQLIRDELRRLAATIQPGDRLFLYVTAHGGKAKGSNPFNTTISCWDRQSIAVKDLESWLDAFPEEVPVVMVMAQCYCGGFAHTVFDQGLSSDGISPHNRVGFFAQQHDLAAAGCRPDIRNDEEYSSYFWGAIAGRTRSGKPLENADLDGDGLISLVEAHTCAMLTSQTIDIPIRTSETVLRTYSRIGNYEHRRSQDDSPEDEPEAGSLEDNIASATSGDSPAASEVEQYAASKPVVLAEMTGTLAELASRGTVDQAALVLGLSEQLELDVSSEVPVIFELFAAESEAASSQRVSYRRSGRGSSTRRDLLNQITEAFPELADRENWKEAEALKPENQQATYERFVTLDGFARYQEGLRAREEAAEARRQQEMREVKFQRLIHTLEAIVLAENLPRLATPHVVEHYHRMLALENSTLGN